MLHVWVQWWWFYNESLPSEKIFAAKRWWSRMIWITKSQVRVRLSFVSLLCSVNWLPAETLKKKKPAQKRGNLHPIFRHPLMMSDWMSDSSSRSMTWKGSDDRQMGNEQIIFHLHQETTGSNSTCCFRSLRCYKQIKSLVRSFFYLTHFHSYLTFHNSLLRRINCTHFMPCLLDHIETSDPNEYSPVSHSFAHSWCKQ